MWFDPAALVRDRIDHPATFATSATFEEAHEDTAPATFATSATFEPQQGKESQESQKSQPSTLDSCACCLHQRRPGLGTRYYGGRDDLPLAYGDHHPLRHLPADLGDACQAFARHWSMKP